MNAFEKRLPARTLTLMALDMVLIPGAYFLALLLRCDFAWSQIPARSLEGYKVLMPVTIVLVVGTLWLLRLYHSIWSFASTSELARLMLGWALDSAALPLIALVAGVRMPVSYWLVGDVLGFCLTAVVRFSYRLTLVLHAATHLEGGEKRALMVGAGESGRALIHEIKVSPQLGMRVAAAVDDNPMKIGVFGSFSGLEVA